MRRVENIVLLIFDLLWCFNCWWEGFYGGAEILIQGQLKSHLFPAWILAKAISMTYSGMLYGLGISMFYEPLLFQVSVFWKFIKT